MLEEKVNGLIESLDKSRIPEDLKLMLINCYRRLLLENNNNGESIKLGALCTEEGTNERTIISTNRYIR